MLAGIIAIHEAGHFAAARAQGIHVTKFAIGFGPAILSYQVPPLSVLCPWDSATNVSSTAEQWILLSA